MRYLDRVQDLQNHKVDPGEYLGRGFKIRAFTATINENVQVIGIGVRYRSSVGIETLLFDGVDDYEHLHDFRGKRITNPIEDSRLRSLLQYVFNQAELALHSLTYTSQINIKFETA